MSLLRYFGHQESALEPQKWLPPEMGLPPLRKHGAPYVTQTELDRAEIQHEFRAKAFQLSDEAQMTEYQRIRDLCLNGVYVMLFIDRSRYEKDQIVFLEWSVEYSQIPELYHGRDRTERPAAYLH